jgi:hypothetical protein
VAAAAAVALVAAWALVETRGWPALAAIYPRVVAAPLLILAVAETWLSARSHLAANDVAVPDLAPVADAPLEVQRRAAALVFAWMVGFVVAIEALGFPLALPLFVFGYLRAYAPVSWAASLVLPAVAWAAFHGLFIRLLHLPFPPGFVWSLLGR